ncbi:NADP-dependent 3-hydroxy acid dehydrogenase YdfG [Novosphingobium sp. CF614]|uniref:SDR family oxidoreductase n=1 Tax=Novosphingobium sp. CF614 TaxID=1884364 RepID=UPI0008F15DA0|nr:SDR family oxidoreductase [Novosphingobium sp. CF614]SFF96580.1 NADP-dependent 3-hydroxy acid dehydrogenase YdfG [Novosphingobium sp. CF614]
MELASAKHAFITGGASGIGLGVGKALAERGIRVTVADVDAEAIDAALAGGGEAFRGVVLDVRDRAGWANAKAEAEAAFGPVDLLFNNAGIASFGYELADMAPEAFDRIVAVDLTGVFNGVSAFAADMRGRRHGHIVNTSSMAGICGPSQAIGGSYAAAKFGVVGLSETLRVELAPHGVGVSVLCPGMTATGIAQSSMKLGGDMRLPAGREPDDASHAGSSPLEIGTADEVAASVLRGIEDNAPYIITHGRGWWPLAHARHVALEKAFEGMRGEG